MKKFYSFRIEQEKIEQLKKLGKKVERPVSFLIRKAIEEYLIRNNGQNK